MRVGSSIDEWSSARGPVSAIKPCSTRPGPGCVRPLTEAPRRKARAARSSNRRSTLNVRVFRGARRVFSFTHTFEFVPPPESHMPRVGRPTWPRAFPAESFGICRLRDFVCLQRPPSCHTGEGFLRNAVDGVAFDGSEPRARLACGSLSQEPGKAGSREAIGCRPPRAPSCQ